jgi:hypothetical protein
MANSEPVVIASDQSAVPVSDNGGSLTVDGSVSVSNFPGTQTVSGTVEIGATSLAALESVTVQNGSGGSAVNIQDGGNSLTVDGTISVDNIAPHEVGFTIYETDAFYNTAQTGTALYTPTSTKKFVVTDLTIATGGTTAGVVTLWQGAVGDTTYTLNTDPVIFRGEFSPTASSKPGVVKTYRVPFVATTADHILRVTTSAAMTVYIQITGYEI